MSMLSARCNELRELALWLDDEFYDVEAAKVRDAADTILELRDDLQRANAENARLRSELESVGTAAYLYGRGDLKAENAKLRKLAHIFMRCVNAHSDCDECILNGEKGSIALDHLCACDGLHELLRELGLEKDA